MLNLIERLCTRNCDRMVGVFARQNCTDDEQRLGRMIKHDNIAVKRHVHVWQIAIILRRAIKWQFFWLEPTNGIESHRPNPSTMKRFWKRSACIDA